MPSPLNRPPALILAVAGTALFAAAFVVVGIGSMLQQHGRFSIGVGAMLVIYGLFVGFAALAGWRAWPLARGGMVSLALLHLMSSVSIARGSGTAWMWLSAALALATVVAAVMPSTRAWLDADMTDPSTQR